MMDTRRWFALVRMVRVCGTFEQVQDIVGPFDSPRSAEQWAEDKVDKWQFKIIELKIS